MQSIDVRHLGFERVICCWQVGDVLIDPGPAVSLPVLLDALDGFEPRAILLTHIHFDHAGGAGTLAARWPDAEIWVHERGARHLADPRRLVASATMLYGAEGMARLWGAIEPIPEERLHILEGGESLEGGFRVAATPGHASHHVAFLHEPSGRAFVGDMAGVRSVPGGPTVAPTPPPDIDLAAWRASLDAISAWQPSSLGLTHFGLAEDPPAQIAAARAALDQQEADAAALDRDGFIAAFLGRIAAACPPEIAAIYEQTAPAEQQWAGLDRARRKAAEAGAAGSSAGSGGTGVRKSPDGAAARRR